MSPPSSTPVVVITGASSGVGRGVALALARQGARLVLAARRDEVLTELAAECAALGGQAAAVPTDVSEPEAVLALRDAALARYGGIDVWLNNAGVAALGAFEEVPLADHLQVLRTDLLGTIAGSYAAIGVFTQRGTGTLINVASALAKIPAPYYASYAAAKAGVVALGISLRQELTERDMHEINVCTVLPMAMDTPFFEHAANYTGQPAVPIPPVYDPREAVTAIVELIASPRDEVVVGRAGKAMTLLDAVLPGLTERGMAALVQTVQARGPGDEPATGGNVHAPAPEGTTIHSSATAQADPAQEG